MDKRSGTAHNSPDERSSSALLLTHAPAIAEAEKILARIEDNTYDQPTLRALDKVSEPMARALVDFAEAARG